MIHVRFRVAPRAVPLHGELRAQPDGRGAPPAEAGARFRVASAGLEPKGVHPLTHRVMNEIGVDTSSHRSKHVSEFLGQVGVRYAIVVCEGADAHCPRLFPFTGQTLYWPFEDPAAFEGPDDARLAKFREVRDLIADRIDRWLDELGVDG